MTTAAFPTLALELRPDRTRVSVVLRGELDITSTPQVAEAADALLADGWRELVLDLRGLEFVDSTAVSLLVGLHRRAAAEGWAFAIVSAPGPVDRILELTGAGDLLARLPGVTAP